MDLKLKEIGDRIVATMKSYVDQATARIIHDFNARIGAIPSGKSAFALAAERGYTGTELQWLESLQGKNGKDADAVDYESIYKRIHERVMVVVEALPPPAPGKDGKDALATPEDVEALTKQIKELVNVVVGAEIAKLPAPQPGKDGRDFDPDHFTKWITGLVDSEIERAVAALPKPKDGKDFDPTEVLSQIGDLVGASVEQAVAAMPKPQDGAPGKDAVVDVEALEKRLEVSMALMVADAVTQLPKPKDGNPGKDAVVDEAHVTELVAAAVAAIPKPKDGNPGKDADPVHPDTLARLVAEEVRRVLDAMPKAKDGEPGRDAVALEVLPFLDPAKSYPRGTFAEYKNGMVRSIRTTDSLEPAFELEKSGWVVCMNGVADEAEEVLNGGRLIKRVTTYTDGRKFVRELKTNILIYHKVWQSDREYTRGDLVTLGGSSWHCESDDPTKDRPGTSAAWVLMVKEGARGKDGNPPPKPEPMKPVRLG